MLAFLGRSKNLRMCLFIAMMTIATVCACVIIRLLFSNINIYLNTVTYKYVPSRSDYSFDKSKICFRSISTSVVFLRNTSPKDSTNLNFHTISKINSVNTHIFFIVEKAFLQFITCITKQVIIWRKCRIRSYLVEKYILKNLFMVGGLFIVSHLFGTVEVINFSVMWRSISGATLQANNAT
jgi:hypothetical protein